MLSEEMTVPSEVKSMPSHGVKNVPYAGLTRCLQEKESPCLQKGCSWLLDRGEVLGLRFPEGVSVVNAAQCSDLCKVLSNR